MRGPFPRAVAPILVLVGGALGACNGGEEDPADDRPSVVRTDSAGMELVLYEGPDRALDASIRKLFDLGSLGDRPTSFHDLPEQAVAFGPDGRLYVLDAGNHRVGAFDSGGRHLRTFGREGRGRGHLLNPVAIWTGSDGETVEILDWAQGSVVSFTTGGEPLETRPAAVSFGIGDRVRPASGGLLATLRRGFRDRSADSTVVTLVHASGGDTTVLAGMTRAATSPTRFPGCRLTIQDRPVFEPEMAWDGRGDRVAVASSVEYRVRYLVGGDLRRIVLRALPPVPVTAASRTWPSTAS